MTCSNSILKETHQNACRRVRTNVPFDTELYTNNQNLQVLIFYELFRQTAYAMFPDGGPKLAILLMQKVIEEMREAKNGYRDATFDKNKFRMSQDRKRNLARWGYFMDIPYDDEVPNEDEEDEDA